MCYVYVSIHIYIYTCIYIYIYILFCSCTDTPDTHLPRSRALPLSARMSMVHICISIYADTEVLAEGRMRMTA